MPTDNALGDAGVRGRSDHDTSDSGTLFQKIPPRADSFFPLDHDSIFAVSDAMVGLQ